MTKRGFTMIELLFIVAIIATLAAMTVPNFLEAQIRAKVGRVHMDMAATAAGLEAYMSDWRVYPPHPEEVREYYRGLAADHFTTSTTLAAISMGGMVLEGSSVLNRLTTPIAYFDNIVLMDPFSNARTSYRYVNTAPLDVEFPALAASVPRRRFLLFSFGPDVDEGYYGGTHAPAHTDKVTNTMANPVWGPYVQYDPTNGTISPGDLIQFGTN